MINLKKNDKLIIIIAVAVVIVAGIGIAAYNPPDDGNGNTGITGGAGTYDVTWQTHTKTVSVDEELYAGKNSPFSTEITIDHENIIKVTVEISWEDDSTYRGLSKGEDTLTADVSCDGITLKEQDYTDDSLTLTIDVSVVTGEKLRRPLKWLRDQGNAFDLTITYEYYDAYVTEGNIKDTGQGNNDPEDPEGPPAYLGMMIQAGLTRW